MEEKPSWDRWAGGIGFPPAPFEVAFLLKYLGHPADRTQITVFHPWKKPMEVFEPQMVEGFSRFLRDVDAGFEGSFTLERHDPDNRTLVATDGRKLEYDFAVVVPAHQPPDVIRTSPPALYGRDAAVHAASPLQQLRDRERHSREDTELRGRWVSRTLVAPAQRSRVFRTNMLKNATVARCYVHPVSVAG